MKNYFALILFFLAATSLSAQGTRYRHIDISMAQTSQVGSWRSEADSAFIYLNLVYNSPQFQDTLRKLSFIPKNYRCTMRRAEWPKENFSGERALDSLFSEPNITWTLDYEPSGDALGETSARSYETTSYRKQIREDMPELTPAFSLAVNLCHEYFHQVSYCHTYDKYGPNRLRQNYSMRGEMVDINAYNNDVTYRVGWIAYFMLRDYQKNGKF